MAAAPGAVPASENQMTNHKIGDRVSFCPSPRSPTTVKGSVTNIATTGEGRGRATWLTVKCDDGKERKVRPGSAQIAA
jgi:hypothetical protein